MSRWFNAGTCSQGYYAGFRFMAMLEPHPFDAGELRVAMIARYKPCGCTVFTRPTMTVQLPALVEAIASGDFDAVSDYDDDDLHMPSLSDHVEDLGSLLATARQEFGGDWGRMA
jgi:hypothetical protein